MFDQIMVDGRMVF